jgi:hypothetical protein
VSKHVKQCAGRKFISAAVLAAPLFLIFCVSKSGVEDPPIITSATYQHTQYNGRNQPVEVRAAKDDVPPFIVTYFTSEENLEKGEGGFSEAPAETGDYYVRVERPAGNGYKAGRNIKIEYHIQKAFISVSADPVQRFAWDGAPKTIAVAADPPVDLTVTYFPAENSQAPATPAAPAALAAPPSAKGRYRAVIFFPGNDRYMGASQEIELIIE